MEGALQSGPSFRILEGESRAYPLVLKDLQDTAVSGLGRAWQKVQGPQSRVLKEPSLAATGMVTLLCKEGSEGSVDHHIG